MTRIEAYAHMLQGGKVTHSSIFGDYWRMTDNRRIVIDAGVLEFTDEFLHSTQYAEGWEIYDSTGR